MTYGFLFTSLAAGVLAAPIMVQAPPATASNLEIRSITVRPAAPVVRPDGEVRLVIEVQARGVSGQDGLTIEVKPGGRPGTPGPRPPGPLPLPPNQPGQPAGPVQPVRPAQPGSSPPGPETVPESVPEWWEGDGLTPEAVPAGPALAPGRPHTGTYGTGSARLVEPDPPQDVTTPPEEAWRTWRFLPKKALDRRYPAGRWTVTATARDGLGAEVTRYTSFWLKRDTKFADFKVERIGRERAVRVSGRLQRVDPKGFIDFAPYPGKEVEILHRSPGGVQWTRVATATTGDNGRFSRRVAGRTDGDWRARFAGTSHHVAKLSSVGGSPR
jgi:hypothetical protein